jgi:ATP-dependent Clp protease ATP-binding subunit ClpC
MVAWLVQLRAAISGVRGPRAEVVEQRVPVDVRRFLVRSGGGARRAGMFERFTDRARTVVVLAQEEARALGHNYIGTEHLLLGLAAEGNGVGATVLAEAGLTPEILRADVLRIIGDVAGRQEGQIPFTPRAKKVLEYSLREALKLSHNYIGTEHLLLAMLAEGEGVAAQILASHGFGPEETRARVMERLGVAQGGTATVGRWRGTAGDPRFLRNAGVTRASAEIGLRARQLAGRDTQSSAHLLRAMVAATDSLAGRALASLQVTADAVDRALENTPVEGTSDESREDAMKRVARIRAEEGRVVIELDDAELAQNLGAGMGAMNPSLAEALDRLRSTLRRELTADDPAGGASMDE